MAENKINIIEKPIEIIKTPEDIWHRLNENVSLDKDGNFVSDLDANFKMGENYRLFDFDFKKVTPKMYKAIEEQSFANTDDFTDEYAVSWWDGDRLVAIVSEFDDAYGKRWLSYIEVTEPYRGHNLSTELLNYAVNGLGCTMLGVAKSNKVAIKVYQDYGFKIIGDNPDNPKQY